MRNPDTELAEFQRRLQEIKSGLKTECFSQELQGTDPYYGGCVDVHGIAPTYAGMKTFDGTNVIEADPSGIDATLVERGKRYGEFPEHARITQALKRAISDSPNWGSLADDMKESLEMIVHKIGRILNGDPSYHDSWHDIVGYTKLVADRLAKESGNG